MAPLVAKMNSWLAGQGVIDRITVLSLILLLNPNLIKILFNQLKSLKQHNRSIPAFTCKFYSLVDIANMSVSAYDRTSKMKIYDSVPWQKPPSHAQTNPNCIVTTQKRHHKSDCTTIADRLRTVRWSNNSHPTGVVKMA